MFAFGTGTVYTARAAQLPPADKLPPGTARERVEIAQRSLAAFEAARDDGPRLLHQRSETHAADQAPAAQAVQAGRRLPAPQLDKLDAQLEDAAGRLDTTRIAVENSVRALDQLEAVDWLLVAEHAGEHIGGAIATA